MRKHEKETRGPKPTTRAEKRALRLCEKGKIAHAKIAGWDCLAI